MTHITKKLVEFSQGLSRTDIKLIVDDIYSNKIFNQDMIENILEKKSEERDRYLKGNFIVTYQEIENAVKKFLISKCL